MRWKYVSTNVAKCAKPFNKTMRSYVTDSVETGWEIHCRIDEIEFKWSWTPFTIDAHRAFWIPRVASIDSACACFFFFFFRIQPMWEMYFFLRLSTTFLPSIFGKNFGSNRYAEEFGFRCNYLNIWRIPEKMYWNNFFLFTAIRSKIFKETRYYHGT